MRSEQALATLGSRACAMCMRTIGWHDDWSGVHRVFVSLARALLPQVCTLRVPCVGNTDQQLRLHSLSVVGWGWWGADGSLGMKW